MGTLGLFVLVLSFQHESTVNAFLRNLCDFIGRKSFDAYINAKICIWIFSNLAFFGRFHYFVSFWLKKTTITFIVNKLSSGLKLRLGMKHCFLYEDMHFSVLLHFLDNSDSESEVITRNRLFLRMVKRRNDCTVTFL